MNNAELRGFIEGMVLGGAAMLIIDRLILLPVAVLLARLGAWWDGRVQPR